MSTYLVTGGAGFIGSHLVDKLLALGHQAIVLDDLSTGKASQLSQKARLVVADVRDQDSVVSLMRQVDGCFHLAAIVSVELCNDQWLSSHRVNVGGTVAVLNAARQQVNKIAAIPVVIASSAAIYGDNSHCPIVETAAAQPLTSYGCDKYASELQAQIAFNIHKVPTMSLRFFNVYGPRQDASSPYSGVISRFVDSSVSNQAVEIFGDGAQYRDFVYVADVVNGLIAAMMCDRKLGQSYNICTSQPTTINNLVDCVSKVGQKTLVKNYLPARRGDIKASLGDAGLARRELGWHAQVPLDQGLQMLMSELLSIS